MIQSYLLDFAFKLLYLLYFLVLLEFLALDIIDKLLIHQPQLGELIQNHHDAGRTLKFKAAVILIHLGCEFIGVCCYSHKELLVLFVFMDFALHLDDLLTARTSLKEYT